MSRSAFLDEAVLKVSGGRGGNGVASFHRTRRQPRGGPNGGNGGDGGAVHAQAKFGISSLADYVATKTLMANKGNHGGGNRKHGASGTDLWLAMPIGTEIHDDITGELHASLINDGDSVVLASGGEGGRGNVTFKTSTNRTPRESTPGQPGEERVFRLTLRLLADAGLVGLPNAGKSSFINKVSNSTSAIGAYPFTTLRPHLGVVEMDDFSQLTIADIPGIAYGSSEGAGLGSRFLRHITRTAVLLHLVDCSSNDDELVVAQTDEVMQELNSVGDDNLPAKPRIIVLTKIDLLSANQARIMATKIRKRYPGVKVCSISSHDGTGIKKLIDATVKLVRH